MADGWEGMKKELRTIKVKVLWVVACLIWAWLLGFWCGKASQRRQDAALAHYAAQTLKSQPMKVVARFIENNGNVGAKRNEPNEASREK